MTNKNFTINHTTKVITITKEFGKRANVFGSTAYKEMKGLRRDFPTYEVVYKTIKKNSIKTTYSCLTYENMKAHIERVNPENLNQFETVKKIASTHSSPYAFVKKWFLITYSNYGQYNVPDALAA